MHIISTYSILLSRISLRGSVAENQAICRVGVKCIVALLHNLYVEFCLVNHQIAWEFWKSEKGCFHSLPSFLAHCLIRPIKTAVNMVNAIIKIGPILLCLMAHWCHNHFFSKHHECRNKIKHNYICHHPLCNLALSWTTSVVCL